MKYRWKEYFRFSKAEKRGIYLLSFAILLILLLKESLIYFNPNPKNEEAEIGKKQLTAILKKVAQEKEKNDFDRRKSKPKRNFSLFDPNQIGKDDWRDMGLSEKQAAVVLNYLEKGGKFRTKKDVQKMYTISDQFFSEIKPYIDLPDTLIKTKTDLKELKATKNKSVRWKKPIVEINAADSLAFQKLYGIGPVFSSRIVNYREQLGGFHSVDQLGEVYGIHDSLLNELASQLKLDSVELQKININMAEVEELGKHPYISWNLANSIVKYREQHGKYTSIEEILQSKLLGDSLLNKLRPYLSR